MDFAPIIKERLSTPEVFEFYGFHRNRAGVVRCMFHNDKHASMKIYDGDRGYHCFSCGAGGDIIHFVRQHFGLTFRDACAKLNDDFNLGLPIRGEIDAEMRRQMEEDAAQRRRKREAMRIRRERVQKAADAAADEWTRLDLQRIRSAPQGHTEPFNDLYVEALQKLDYAEYLWECAEIRRQQCELPVSGR